MRGCNIGLLLAAMSAAISVPGVNMPSAQTIAAEQSARTVGAMHGQSPATLADRLAQVLGGGGGGSGYGWTEPSYPKRKRISVAQAKRNARKARNRARNKAAHRRSHH